MNYRNELTKAMELLAKDERVIFLGQTASYPGSPMYGTLEKIATSKRMELPIIEDVQMGMSIGLSLQGYVPVSLYPRMDFLICATNQLVNHLDKTEEMSNHQFKPKVIIRTAIGSTVPFYPGIQHCSDYTELFKSSLKNINIVKLENSKKIIPEYKRALESEKSTLLIEISDMYDKR